MPKVMKAVTVRKPVHEVFEYVDEPMHLPEIWPSLYEVKAVEAKPVRKFDWLYNLAGKHFAGKTKTIEHVVDERIVEKAEGDIESTFIWKFQGENGFTKLAFEADYKLPVGLEPTFEQYLVKRNELEAQVMLDSLKARLEV
ncbi:MAG: SRPBCC family protein [Verrucomicrobiota bacterium]